MLAHQPLHSALAPSFGPTIFLVKSVLMSRQRVVPEKASQTKGRVLKSPLGREEDTARAVVIGLSVPPVRPALRSSVQHSCCAEKIRRAIQLTFLYRKFRKTPYCLRTKSPAIIMGHDTVQKILAR